jgi:hypothetical protein
MPDVARRRREDCFAGFNGFFGLEAVLIKLSGTMGAL